MIVPVTISSWFIEVSPPFTKKPPLSKPPTLNPLLSGDLSNHLPDQAMHESTRIASNNNLEWSGFQHPEAQLDVISIQGQLGFYLALRHVEQFLNLLHEYMYRSLAGEGNLAVRTEHTDKCWIFALELVQGIDKVEE
jgi:hypothetical protein